MLGIGAHNLDSDRFGMISISSPPFSPFPLDLERFGMIRNTSTRYFQSYLSFFIEHFRNTAGLVFIVKRLRCLFSFIQLAEDIKSLDNYGK